MHDECLCLEIGNQQHNCGQYIVQISSYSKHDYC